MVVDDFANRIKELRQQQGLSQEKFALKIDMDRTYYASVEACLLYTSDAADE